MRLAPAVTTLTLLGCVQPTEQIVHDPVPDAGHALPVDAGFPADSGEPLLTTFHFTRRGVAAAELTVFRHDDRGTIIESKSTDRRGNVSFETREASLFTAAFEANVTEFETWVDVAPGEHIEHRIDLIETQVDRPLGAVAVDLRAWPKGAKAVGLAPVGLPGVAGASWTAPQLQDVLIRTEHLLDDGRLELMALGYRDGVRAYATIGVLDAREDWNGTFVPIKQWRTDFLTIRMFGLGADGDMSPSIRLRKFDFEARDDEIPIPLALAEQLAQLELRYGADKYLASQPLRLPTTVATPVHVEVERMLLLRDVQVDRTDSGAWSLTFRQTGPSRAPERMALSFRGAPGRWRFWLPADRRAYEVPFISPLGFDVGVGRGVNEWEIDLGKSSLSVTDDNRTCRAVLN